MNVDVMVNGRPWKVAVEPAEAFALAGPPTRQPRWGALAGKVTVTIKGKSRVVDASWVDQDTLSLIDGGTAREIRLHPRSDNSIGVEVDGRLFEATVAPGDAKRGRDGFSTPNAGKTPPDPVSIKAPMPGRIVRVLVAVGEHVTARQAVVVIEAMKMENELRTPRDGVVKEVLVAPGTAVESGAVLVVVDQ
jgi:biotin carboxyl carrier protein